MRPITVLVVLAAGLALDGSLVARESPVPVAASPGGDDHISIIGQSCPTYSWSAVPGAIGYRVVVHPIREDGRLVGPAVSDASLQGEVLSWSPSLESCLSARERYAWMVQALTPEGAGAWSEPLLFQVASAPTEDELRAALAVLERHFGSLESRSGDPATRKVEAPVGSVPATSPGRVALGVGTPQTETQLFVRDNVGDNFGILIDSSGVAGSEVGLHVGTTRYASLAKNAFFEAGWQRFATDAGAFLQEIEPDGHVSFKVASTGENPIVWDEALRLDPANLDLTVGAAFLKIPSQAGAPLDEDCDSSTETGRLVWASASSTIYICRGVSGWVEFPPPT